MSTYVNDLRLEEIGTGERSGTWGTATNTNLELIGEALGFGTEAITTNADTHATTVADGSSDPGRAMFIKYTGTLDSACTITIGPNTMSRVHIIENATSGSQNIIIKQGSGATITIPNGHAKVVYLDGAGSGAAVVDAFADLNTSGTLTTEALAVDNITIDGSEIDNSSGDLTLDIAGDLVVNADGGNLVFQDDSVNVGELANSSSDFVVASLTQDKDILFKGNDGGSTITALTLDMSDAGTATFNHDIKLGDNGQVIFGDGSDLTLYSSGANVTIAAPNGDLTIDISGDLSLDYDGGDLYLKDAGTSFGFISNGTSNQLIIGSLVSNADLEIKGNDGGSIFTALTFDMSEAGAATFNNNVTAYSDARLKSDIKTIEGGLEKVSQLRGVTYIRDDNKDGGQQIGVIAQEVEEIIPQIVKTADDEMGTKSVDYGRITAVLIESIKELKAEIDELKEKLNG